MTSGYLRKLVTGLLVGAALFVVWIATALVVGAAGDSDTTICINYTTCYDSTSGALVPNPNPIPAQTVYTPAPVAYAPGQVAYAPSGSGYPPNTVVSTYFDPRYGVVSVVTDGSGNLIDVNAATGQRIYPYLPDYGYGYGGGFGYTGGYFGNGYSAYSPWGFGWWGGYGANYCGTGLYAPRCPNVPSIQPAQTTNVVVGTRIVPVTVKSASEPVQVPVAAPQPAPAQVATSMAAAQEPAAAPQAPVATPLSAPTSGSGLGVTVQGASTAVVAAPAADPGNDDHRG